MQDLSPAQQAQRYTRGVRILGLYFGVYFATGLVYPFVTWEPAIRTVFRLLNLVDNDTVEDDSSNTRVVVPGKKA
eukprot:m.70231 g.70231  ORF g.70231 m.70231 type:complete len:75 (+) comp24194_c0_seq1:75-299(+)